MVNFHIRLHPISFMPSTPHPLVRPRLAPLRPKAPRTTVPRLSGIIFDLDGTLTLPQPYLFAQMRTALLIPPTADILTHIAALPTPAERAAASRKIEEFEKAAIASQEPQPGLRELMDYLDTRDVRKAILTRNCEAPTKAFVERWLPGVYFDPLVTRKFEPTKPAPDGIWEVCRLWGIGGTGMNKGNAVVMVGDSVDDMAAGRAAGAATVLIRNDANKDLVQGGLVDLVVDRLDELIPALEDGLVVMEPESLNLIDLAKKRQAMTRGTRDTPPDYLTNR